MNIDERNIIKAKKRCGPIKLTAIDEGTCVNTYPKANETIAVPLTLSDSLEKLISLN